MGYMLMNRVGLVIKRKEKEVFNSVSRSWLNNDKKIKSNNSYKTILFRKQVVHSVICLYMFIYLLFCFMRWRTTDYSFHIFLRKRVLGFKWKILQCAQTSCNCTKDNIRLRKKKSTWTISNLKDAFRKNLYRVTLVQRSTSMLIVSWKWRIPHQQ